MDLDTLEFRRLYDRLRQKKSRLVRKQREGKTLTYEEQAFIEESPLLLAQRHLTKFTDEPEQGLSAWQKALQKQKNVDVGYKDTCALEKDKPSSKQKIYDLIELPNGEIIPIQRKKKKGKIWGYDSIV